MNGAETRSCLRVGCETEKDFSLRGLRVLVRGAGEMATGVAHRLIRSGFRVALSEAPEPMAVRRAVCFSEAVYEGIQTVEGVTCRRVYSAEEVFPIWNRGEAAVLVDPEAVCLDRLRPAVVVDAILAKRNLGTRIHWAPLTIGLGPGFTAPADVHLVIETNRGHNLGRLIYHGAADPNTGAPGEIGGYTKQRVLRAPAPGVFLCARSLGDVVPEGDLVGTVGSREIRSEIPGVLRGLLRDGTEVIQGTKLGDIDPRGRTEYVRTISEKARAIGGSVLEGILAAFNL